MSLWGKLHKNYYIIYIILRNNLNAYISHCGNKGGIDKKGGVSYIADFLPVSKTFTTTIDIQISYFSGVRSSKSYF